VDIKNRFLTAEQWLSLSMDVDESQVVIGSPSQCIIRPGTKNIIEAPEKAFKTTFMLRLTMGLSCGQTVFSLLPVLRPRRVLYVHGELSPPEIQERTHSAAQDLPRPLNNFYQGRDHRIHLGEKDGQQILKNIVVGYEPEDLVIDPWQAFITGFDENEFKDVSRATHFLDELIEECKVTVYLVTHLGKDHSRGTRGHSSLGGWRDTLIKLERKKELVEVKVDPRWAAPVEPFKLKFENGTLRTTDESGFKPQADEIRKFLQSQGGESTVGAVGAHLDLTSDSLRKALKRAEEAKAIVVAGDAVRLPEFHEKIAGQVVAVFTGG